MAGTRRNAARAQQRDKGRAKWSATATRTSDALDLEGGVFTSASPKHIAASLKRSAEHSQRRKSRPFRSAMSVLTFYVNRAGRDLPASRRRVLEAAKAELRRQFRRPKEPKKETAK